MNATMAMRNLYRKHAYNNIRRCFSIIKRNQTCLFYCQRYGYNYYCFVRLKSNKTPSSLFMPIPIKVQNNPDDINIGEELSNKLQKADILKILNKFWKLPEICILAEENGLDNKLFHQAFISFRRMCMAAETLEPDLHIIFSDILQESGHITDIFPYFLQHTRQVFPHLECMEELKKISDLRFPANWYPEARSIDRKIIFHAGPTNSGKTYHALERFLNAKNGMYCGPLKLLAVEVFNTSNEKGTPCDLVTGEERCYANSEDMPSSHVSCTVEMASVTQKVDVAVIDEIQMIKDLSRGWAWTRALLGLAADEIHVCGEAAAIDLVREILSSVGEELEVRKYKRLTKFSLENKALGNLKNVKSGDCIVCFSKNDIYNVSLELEKQGHECAVIYGGLPPTTKLAQAKKFNDPDDPCKILVATDAIGMGLNLSIRRVIFYSLIRPVLNEKGEKEMTTLSTSQALQISGRAGRYKSQYSEGFATTYNSNDLPVLQDILSKPVENIETAGLHPTADQVELFAYHLPHATLSNLIDIFVSLSQVDTSYYFMCNIEDFKFLADMIQHVPLPLRARYVFCCSPINRKLPFVCTMFLKYARQYSRNEPLTFRWICRNIGWPLHPPKSILELVHLEAVFDVLDLYLWLSYRFVDLFPDAKPVREIQHELDLIIQQGVLNIINILKASATTDKEDEEIPWKQRGHSFKDQYEAEEDIETGINSHIKSSFTRGQSKTQELLAKGLLTPKMLEQLKKEWQKSLSKESNSEPSKNHKGK